MIFVLMFIKLSPLHSVTSYSPFGHLSRPLEASKLQSKVGGAARHAPPDMSGLSKLSLLCFGVTKTSPKFQPLSLRFAVFNNGMSLIKCSSEHQVTNGTHIIPFPMLKIFLPRGRPILDMYTNAWAHALTVDASRTA